MHTKKLLRAAAVVAGTAGIALAVPVSAIAHVTVRPDEDASGSYSKLTVRVPNESDSAGTTKVQLDLPEDAPFAHVSVQPHIGWTAKINREKLDEPKDVGDVTLDEIVTSVTWTADDGVSVWPDQFDEFSISVGPLPDPGTYQFPATQTYDDGTVVAWDQPPADVEPEKPAPTVTVTEAKADDHHQEPAAHEEDSSAEDSSNSASTSDGFARGVAAGGVVVGAAGLGIGALAFRRSRA